MTRRRRGLLLTLLAVATLQNGGSRIVAAEPVAPARAPVKNVLFIISDDLKASALGCYGNSVCRTPHIDRLAARGALFTRAYCQGLSCRPSRQSLMFSRYRGVGEVNLGQHFRQHGRYSARVGKIYHMRVPGDIIAGTDGQDVASSWTERFNLQGLEAHTPGRYACLNQNIFTTELAGRQSTRMPHRMFVTVRYPGDGSDQPDYQTASKAIELLEKHREAPFFLAVGLIRPHYPMVAPQSFFDLYPWKKMELAAETPNDLDDIPPAGRAGTQSSRNPIGKYPDNQRRMWSGYYASVTFMDAQVGRILSALDRLGLRESTAVVFTSDHGYHLGEHGFWQKSNLHEEVVRVPLIVSAPGRPPARTGSLAELTDVFPTLSELAGLGPPAGTQGVSLAPVLEHPEREVRESALSLGSRNSYGLRTRDWAYMQYGAGDQEARELYDMRNDPRQFTNLAADQAHAGILTQMRAELKRRLRAIAPAAP